MPRRFLAVLIALAAVPVSADWNPQAAAAYLDARQKEWFAWPPALKPGGPCLSCHTGLPYLLARPALRRALSESGPTAYETGLRDALRARLAPKPAVPNPAMKDAPNAPAGPGAVVEAVLTTLVLADAAPPSGSLSPETQQAFDRLWSLQFKQGPSAGAWNWYGLDLDPWESADSVFFGASLAALAAGSTPPAYLQRPDVRLAVAALSSYLRADYPRQPLHNRIAVLWASTRLPEVLHLSNRQALLSEIGRLQLPSGGWTLESLGPFPPHPKAPPRSTGADSYATAFTAFVLRHAGLSPMDPVLEPALAWLRSHQDPATGTWPALSMNKVYPPDSIQVRFMQDATTAYAALALLDPPKR